MIKTNKKKIKIEFKDSYNIYNNIHLEIRLSGTQIRFYEVNTKEKKEYNLKKETIKWLIKKNRLSRIKILKQALKGDKSIFI